MAAAGAFFFEAGAAVVRLAAGLVLPLAAFVLAVVLVAVAVLPAAGRFEEEEEEAAGVARAVERVVLVGGFEAAVVALVVDLEEVPDLAAGVREAVVLVLVRALLAVAPLACRGLESEKEEC